MSLAIFRFVRRISTLLPCFVGHIGGQWWYSSGIQYSKSSLLLFWKWFTTKSGLRLFSISDLVPLMVILAWLHILKISFTAASWPFVRLHIIRCSSYLPKTVLLLHAASCNVHSVECLTHSSLKPQSFWKKNIELRGRDFHICGQWNYRLPAVRETVSLRKKSSTV